ncbi:group-specific protein [Fictibacillus nanhaiensis]|uniref:group-specific protein n=1 Tax=Fictibacillus nanhaiensis TaxID=742169 RepID=UPI001C960BB1|nr:group-specific protein [Fictibacillus nanhaiensis]MBY6037004.1 group-specific protein [Fictibacillus nanhaiensis]
MKFYIASSLQNIQQVRCVASELTQKGFIHTYDWTQNERVDTLDKLQSIGEAEQQAVKESEFVVVLLPGGKGSHIEFGIALGLNKRLYLYSPNDEIYNPSKSSTFYHVSGVDKFVGTLDEFTTSVLSKESAFNLA